MHRFCHPKGKAVTCWGIQYWLNQIPFAEGSMWSGFTEGSMWAGFEAKFRAEEACSRVPAVQVGWPTHTLLLVWIVQILQKRACKTGNLSLALAQVVVAVFLAMLQHCLKVWIVQTACQTALTWESCSCSCSCDWGRVHGHLCLNV